MYAVREIPRKNLARAAFASHPDLWFAIISACWVALLYRHVIGAAFVYDDVVQIQTILLYRPGIRLRTMLAPLSPLTLNFVASEGLFTGRYFGSAWPWTAGSGA